MYLIDSNCFIQNYRVYNPMDIALSFWKKITELAIDEKFCSIDKVKAELVSSNDSLSKWIKSLPSSFFKPISDQELKPYINEIVPWAVESDYKQAAKDRFLRAEYADPFLVSYAMEHRNEDVVVVTEEVSAKLPDVCTHFDIRSIHFVDMLREMGETY